MIDTLNKTNRPQGKRGVITKIQARLKLQDFLERELKFRSQVYKSGSVKHIDAEDALKFFTCLFPRNS